MPTAVVTGANSGIGHAFAQLLIEEGYEVHAADHEVGEKLQTLQCRLHRLDIRSPEQITLFAAQLANKPIDILLNVAGVMAPADTLPTISHDSLTRVFETNTFGPLLLTQALLPSILLAAESNPTSPARIGIVSSRVGSIGDNSTSGNYAYRASKSAVNMFGKCLAIDLAEKNIAVSLLHPGIVNSNMNPGGGGVEGVVEPEEAARKLWGVFMSRGLAESGRFWHREGEELPW